MNRLKLGLAETVYRSSKREPLGKSYQRGYQLPEKVTVLLVCVAALRSTTTLFTPTHGDKQTQTVSGSSFLDIRQVTDPAFLFGISSDKSEAAKALLYPHPDEAEMKVAHSIALFVVGQRLRTCRILVSESWCGRKAAV